MVLPLQITFRNMQSSEILKEWIQEEANKLNEFHGKITCCRVIVELPNRRRKAGNLYHVRIDLTVPGGEMVVKRQPNLRALPRRAERKPVKSLEVRVPHKKLRQAINDAFSAMQRLLQDYSQRRRHEVKLHNMPPTGRVIRLFPQEGYGFLEAVDGHEIYFHKNSVLNHAFDRLTAGSVVSFVEETGEQGPQASTVKLLRHRTAAQAGEPRAA